MTVIRTYFHVANTEATCLLWIWQPDKLEIISYLQIRSFKIPHCTNSTREEVAQFSLVFLSRKKEGGLVSVLWLGCNLSYRNKRLCSAQQKQLENRSGEKPWHKMKCFYWHILQSNFGIKMVLKHK